MDTKDTSDPISGGQAAPVDLTSIADFDFAPDWAKAAPGTRFAKTKSAPSAFDKRAMTQRRPARPFSADGPRPSRRPAHSPSPFRPAPQGGTAPALNRFSMPFLPVHACLLPNQRFLKAIVRKLQTSRQCHALSDICALFLDREVSCDIKIESTSKDKEVQLYQCLTCLMVSSTRTLAERHLLDTHLEDWFDKATIQTEPPSGSFTCVARCGLTGTLLGPPNHHAYAENVQRTHQARSPNMPMNEYTSRIEILHDSELVEQWKEECRAQTRFTLKAPDTTDGQPMQQAEAEAWLMAHGAPRLVRAARRVIMPGALVGNLKDTGLERVVREAIRKEKLFPTSLKFALRGAFRSKGLHLWKSPRGATFVSSIQPSPLNLDHVAEPVRNLLVFIGEHPRCTHRAILEALYPEPGPDNEEDARKHLAPLSWLIEKGHVLQHADASLCLPEPVNKGNSG